jgi:hypothetical protein
MGREGGVYAGVNQQAGDQKGQEKDESLLPDEEGQRQVTQVTHRI